MRHPMPTQERHGSGSIFSTYRHRYPVRALVPVALLSLFAVATPSRVMGQDTNGSATGTQPQLCQVPQQDQGETDCVPGPSVRYRDGVLSIDPNGASLHAILNEIRAQTGITIDASGDALQKRLYDKVGPAPVRDALVSLLYGTGLNYILQSASIDPQSVHKIILSAETPANSPATSQRASAASASETEPIAAFGGGVEAVSEPSPAQEAQPVPPIRSQANPSSIPGIPAGFDLQKAAAEAHKTPGEILRDLQRQQIEILDAQAPAP